MRTAHATLVMVFESERGNEALLYNAVHGVNKQKVRFELLSVALGLDVRDHLTAPNFHPSLKSV